jgi:hypothetical protein
MLGASPDGAHPGLYRNLLDAAIRQVPALYYPGSRHGINGGEENKNAIKTQLLAS